MQTTERKTIQDCIDILSDASTQLAAFKEAESLRSELQKTEERLKKRQKLVAVFGAFSAGKSSLINALVEDNVLTVSPNPTTATVSHIVSEKNLATVEITAKTKEQMWDDVFQAALALRHQPASLEEAMTWASRLEVASVPAPARRSASFLKAASSGYAQMKEKLGTTWSASHDDIQKFTADERYACYLQRVDVPHSADVLTSGISLVDTPGVDSIHRRHTDVAFDYMRKADAIIFVLYYTHAFSRADKDFLLQLAGVQDVFGLNKLFVVINAVDLAKSEEERENVRLRVETELKGLGIRQPKVYEVSSQVAFAASQLDKCEDETPYVGLIRQRLRLTPEEAIPDVPSLREQSGVALLTKELAAYVESQAEELAVHSSTRLLQTVRDRIQVEAEHKQMLLTNSEQERALHMERVLKQKQSFQDRFVDIGAGQSDVERSLWAEWEELAFHAGERIRLRYNALFREAFHPGRFRGTQNPRLSLQEGAEDLAGMLNRQVEVESRTFGLRIATQSGKALDVYKNHVASDLSAVGVSQTFTPSDITDEGAREDSTIRSNLGGRIFASGFRHFSSAKQFFESGGQDAMMKELELIALDAARGELAQITSRMMNEQRIHLRNELTAILEQGIHQLETEQSALHETVTEDVAQAWAKLASWFTEAVGQ